MGLAVGALTGWILLLFQKPWNSISKVFLLIAAPLELLAAGMSGRPYFHYLAALWPTAIILCAMAFESVRRRSLVAIVVTALLVLDTRRYALFARKAWHVDAEASAVVSYIDANTMPHDRILPVGAVAATAVALRARREPAGRFPYQLAMVHRANPYAAQQREEEIQSLGTLLPKIVFSMPSAVGGLCGDSKLDVNSALQEGYDYGRMRKLLEPVLRAHYHRVQNPEFGSACVFALGPSTSESMQGAKSRLSRGVDILLTGTPAPPIIQTECVEMRRKLPWFPPGLKLRTLKFQ
jgi:hypothetical protein